MAEIGIGVYKETPAAEPKLVKTADLLKPGNNPLLTSKEKLFVRALVRGSAFSCSDKPDDVKMTGLSPDAEKQLRQMVIDSQGDKLPYDLAVMKANNKNLISPLLGCNIGALDPGRMTISGITGDLSSVIERVSNGRGNCLEFALTMQLVAKVFYPKEISAAEILGYTHQSNIKSAKDKPTRHFHLYTKRNTASENPHYLTDYGGRDKSVTPEDAQQKIASAQKAGEPDVKNIYTGFLTLTKLNE